MEPRSERILIVDPDPSIRALLVAVLRRTGIETESVPNREAALDMAAVHQYTAVIVEPRMPGGDVLLGELYAFAGDGQPPNIIVATTPDAKSAALARRPGVRAVLIKPFEIETLCATVEAICER